MQSEQPPEAHRPPLAQPTAITILAIKFVEDVKSTFGEQARETIAIFEALGRFKSGEVSKKETLSTISDTLGSHCDLKHDLMNVLHHKAAQWGPEDFELPLLPVQQPEAQCQQPAPQFLQPVHQPQMRLPSMFSPWQSSNRSLPALGPPVMSDFQWESIDYGNTWDEEAIRYGFQHEQLLEDTSALSPTESFRTHHLENPRLRRRSESVTAISPRQLQATFPPATSKSNVLGEPFASAIGQPALDMPPPPRKRSRKSSSAQSKAEQQYNQDRTRRGPEDLQDQQSTGSRASQAPSAGRFVHSICGKRFANRFKVKKHHWGNKINDVNTTTGCWYKNHKPNVDWDAHPSCKEAPRYAEEPMPTPVKSLQAKATSVENKAPTVPTMGAGPRNILPNAPARHLSQPIRSPHAPSSYMQGGYLPYHSHGLPPTASSSPFQNLLTVVNVAANIESPTPKGRNDSVIFSNLDAEAFVVEHTPAWAFTRADQASYLDPVFDQHQRRPFSPRSTTYNNAMEPEW